MDLVATAGQGRYLELDAAQTLSTMMVNGSPDSVRFIEFFDNLIKRVASAARHGDLAVLVYGEAVDLLLTQGSVHAAVLIEDLTNELLKRNNVHILCGYSASCVHGAMDNHTLGQINARHSAVYRV